jgi:hypothetical protein
MMISDIDIVYHNYSSGSHAGREVGSGLALCSTDVPKKLFYLKRILLTWNNHRANFSAIRSKIHQFGLK